MFGVAALPATAVAPVKFSQTITLPVDFPCPDGTVLSGTATINDSGIAFRDASGGTTHVFLHDTITTTITGTNGLVASGTNTQNETFDVDSGAFSVRGVFTDLSVPGVGIVAHAAGRLLVDGNGNVVFVTPSLTNAGNSICAALE
ncbi:MAG TPA: hypothetical protein VJV22_11685 [Acidobacteriaceae bacterium]|nr:hypothetical protein [Acidobacteriaceae bacterium]